MVYILKFQQPLGNARHQAKYYMGYCEEGRLDERLKEHRSGKGAAITRAAHERGIAFEVVLRLEGFTRQDERRLKNWKNYRRVIKRYGGRV